MQPRLTGLCAAPRIPEEASAVTAVATFDDLVQGTSLWHVFQLAEVHCVYDCCGLDAMEGDVDAWPAVSRGLYDAWRVGLDAASRASCRQVVARILALLAEHGHLDSWPLNQSIVADDDASAGARRVLERLMRDLSST